MRELESPQPTAAKLRELGLSSGYASDLANGVRRPSLTLAVRIQRELGVPVEHWVGDEAAEASS